MKTIKPRDVSIHARNIFVFDPQATSQSLISQRDRRYEVPLYVLLLEIHGLRDKNQVVR